LKLIVYSKELPTKFGDFDNQKFVSKIDHNIGFQEERQFCAGNFDHNIDPGA
jgi:hypothetical protein